MLGEKWIAYLKHHSRITALGSAAVIVVVGLGAFSLLPAAQGSSSPQYEPVRLAAQENDPRSPPRMLESGAPFSFADLVERVSPAVVTITAVEQETASDQLSQLNDLPEPFRDLFNQFNQGRQLQPRKAVSMGSGFIIDRSGVIVTNDHVVDGAKKVTVKLSDGRSLDAKLIGADAATDVAVLRVKSDKPLPTVEFGNDRQLRVGDWVVAVGNPFGLSNTVTAGIVSSIGRDIGSGPYTDFIQIDAPINRGNSGGPTFDLRGQVVGMNSMIFSPSGGSVGIGFAIPSSTIKDVVAQLEAHGRVARGWLGVEIQSITPEIASSLGMKEPKGAIIASVVQGGPAAKAGLQQGDVVLAVNGKAVEDSRDLSRRIAAITAGSNATLTVNRGGKAEQIVAHIAPRKDEKVASNEEPQPGGGPAAATGEAMGLGLAAVTPQTRRMFNLDDAAQGVLITKVDPDSDAADKGLQPGDVVMSLSNKVVRTPQDIQRGISEAQTLGRKSVLLLVATSNGSRYVAVDIGKT
ncbi:MAG: Do family serine endopeptidase [Alphaproteobacteria bacterium]|nr:Do family serine endopeptidase [Alphaproteobacteria bacterium]MBV9694595.1 Do family serine endopeptidase [Alphaproteobacteria bacterium]